MTLTEKFGQLFMVPFEGDGNMAQYKNGIFGFQFSTNGQSGNDQMMHYARGSSALQMAKETNKVQRWFVDSTRLGIPIIPFDEALHGLVRSEATAFPQAIGLAATWDTTLMNNVAAAIATEVRTRGIRQILSPVLNIAADPRWGRVEETYGEDPFLVSQMGLAYVKAFEKRNVIATPKHFIANSADGGRDSYPVQYSDRLMQEVYYLPFITAIQEGGARSVMTAYNSFDGTPCSANAFLLTEKLRKEWGFHGFVISDAGATGGANVLHFTASDYADATKKSIEAGLDVIFQTSYNHYSLFFNAFQKDIVDLEAIDSAVAHVLRVKFGLGLFENPYTDTTLLIAPDYTKQHKQLALRSAQESIVLLKNDQNILPISKNISSVAVIGTDAEEGRLGGYSREGMADVSILQGIRKKLGPEKVKYAPGCGSDSNRFAVVPEQALFHTENGKPVPGLKGEYLNNIVLQGKPELIRTDSRVDFGWTLFSPAPDIINYDFYSVRWNGFLVAPETGIFNIGIRGDDGYRLWINDSLIIDNWQTQTVRTITTPYFFKKDRKYDIRLEFHAPVGNARIQFIWNVGVENNTKEKIADAADLASECDVAIVVVGIEEGEFRDRASLRLPGRQEELIRIVAAIGKPVIVVLVGGGPVVVTDFINDIDGMIEVWYPGDQGGTAVADVLFGDYNPAGRLPIGFPMDESQLPWVYYHKPTGRGDDYMNLTGKPMFPFGFGLSYTQFEYSDLRFEKPSIGSCDSTTVSFTLKNTGKYDGDEVVQLYIRDEIASVARPVMELKGFQRIHLKSGESKTISFKITPLILSMLNEQMQRVVEPGVFRIMIGASSNDIRLRGSLNVAN
ncbi:MAG: beta-1,3-glucosyltransferase [Bacteroidetes bacterium HGW-Bacteroidetes-6]|nr:MAG: beta-1,3-glucosyltransferase [Bacteroidetes bacterium HGW-Bacteroidetes-6]